METLSPPVASRTRSRTPRTGGTAPLGTAKATPAKAHPAARGQPKKATKGKGKGSSRKRTVHDIVRSLNTFHKAGIEPPERRLIHETAWLHPAFGLYGVLPEPVAGEEEEETREDDMEMGNVAGEEEEKMEGDNREETMAGTSYEAAPADLPAWIPRTPVHRGAAAPKSILKGATPRWTYQVPDEDDDTDNGLLDGSEVLERNTNVNAQTTPAEPLRPPPVVTIAAPQPIPAMEQKLLIPGAFPVDSEESDEAVDANGHGTISPFTSPSTTTYKSPTTAAIDHDLSFLEDAPPRKGIRFAGRTAFVKDEEGDDAVLPTDSRYFMSGALPPDPGWPRNRHDYSPAYTHMQERATAQPSTPGGNSTPADTPVPRVLSRMTSETPTQVTATTNGSASARQPSPSDSSSDILGNIQTPNFGDKSLPSTPENEVDKEYDPDSPGSDGFGRTPPPWFGIPAEWLEKDPTSQSLPSTPKEKIDKELKTPKSVPTASLFFRNDAKGKQKQIQSTSIPSSPTQQLQNDLDETVQDLQGFHVSDKRREKQSRRIEAQKAVRRREREERYQKEAEARCSIIKTIPDSTMSILDNARNCKQRDAEVAKEGLTRHDIGTLLPVNTAHDGIGWLNDEIVNTFFKKVVQKKLDKVGYQKKEGSIPNYHAFTTFLYTNYTTKGYDSVASWVKRARIAGSNLFSCEKILIPINAHNHWTLVIISGTEKTIEYYDSLGDGKNKKMRDFALNFVKDVLGGKFVEKEWKQVDSQSPQQVNGSDCGAFVCVNGLAKIMGREPSLAVHDEDAQDMWNARFMVGGILCDPKMEFEV